MIVDLERLIQEKNEEIIKLKQRIVELEEKTVMKIEDRKHSVTHNEIIEELKQIKC